MGDERKRRHGGGKLLAAHGDADRGAGRGRGGFGPTVERPIAMGYVTADHAKEGSPLTLTVRDRPLAARVAKLPFVAHRYHRG